MTSVAIIGLGAAADHIHLPAYALLRGQMRVVGACDPDPQARERARRKWRVPVFEDAQQMLQQVHPEVVTVCTPPALHRDHALLALSEGCHVFCEKPAAETLEQADEIARAAEAASRLVAVNTQFPSMRIHEAAKHAIGTPAFGKLVHLHVSHTMRTNDITEAGWRGQLSRRLCFEFGVHVFELVRFLFGENPVRLVAHMPGPGHQVACDIVNFVALEFADGRGASILLDRLSQGPERYLDLRLDGETATVHTSIGGQLRLEAGMHTRERRPYLGFSFVKGGQARLEQGNRSKVIAQDGLNPFCDSTARHFSRFLQAIAHRGTPPGDIRDHRDTLALVIAAYDSAANRQWVEMSRYRR